MFKMLKRGLGLAAALMLGVLCCGIMPAKAADQPVFVETQSEVSVTLTTDKAEYEAGETVKFSLVVVNNQARHYTSKAIPDHQGINEFRHHI